MKISIARLPDGSLITSLSKDAADECDDIEIDIEPCAAGEEPYIYVTVTREGDEIYEGRLPLKP